MLDLPPGLHGAHLRSDLAAQLGAPAVQTAIRAKLLRPYSRRVLVTAANALQLRTRAAAALLTAGCDAVLSRHTAALMYGCSAADQVPIDVLIPYSRRLDRHTGLVVHHGRYSDQDVIRIDGLSVLRLPMALAELLCTAAKTTALACIDQALGFLPAEDRDGFSAAVAEQIQARHDIRGTKRARFLLDLATGLPESPAESWLLLFLVEEGFPLPTLQYAVTDLNGQLVYRLDFAWPELRIGLEYDGYAAHADRQEHDLARDADLSRRGWIMIHADADDLRNPGALFQDLRSAFHRRRYQL